MCVLHDCTAVDVVAGQSCCSIVALVVLVMELVTGIQVIRLILSSLHELCQNYGIRKGLFGCHRLDPWNYSNQECCAILYYI